jgi:hypothetical protein
LDILGRIKSTLGGEFPVLIKMNSEDFIDGGLTVDDSLQIARLLDQTGIDAIELSGGTADAASQFKPVRQGRLPSEDKEVFYRDGVPTSAGSLIIRRSIRASISVQRTGMALGPCHWGESHASPRAVRGLSRQRLLDRREATGWHKPPWFAAATTDCKPTGDSSAWTRHGESFREGHLNISSDRLLF